MGLKKISSPAQALQGGLSVSVSETLKEYRIIYIGYVISMGIFVVTSVYEIFDGPNLVRFLYVFNLDKIIFSTMLFSVFMIVYFVREQEKMKYRSQIEEQEKVKEGVWIAEQEIRNQIVLINQATYVAERMGNLDRDMIKIIRENTKKMEKQLMLLQKSDVDPREFNDILAKTTPIHES